MFTCNIDIFVLYDYTYEIVEICLRFIYACFFYSHSTYSEKTDSQILFPMTAFEVVADNIILNIIKVKVFHILTFLPIKTKFIKTTESSFISFKSIHPLPREK